MHLSLAQHWQPKITHPIQVYIEAFHTVPKGICRTIVRFLAWDYFGSWAMFPILFVLGPEGFGHITAYGSVIAHLVREHTHACGGGGGGGGGEEGWVCFASVLHSYVIAHLVCVFVRTCICMS